MNLPAEFMARTRQLMGEEACTALCEALQQESPVSIRLNPLKSSGIPAGSKPVAWCRDGYYLSERPAFTFDPLFHAGVYYVQEAASMSLDLVMRRYVGRPSVMLDLCAAPGESLHWLRPLCRREACSFPTKSCGTVRRCWPRIW